MAQLIFKPYEPHTEESPGRKARRCFVRGVEGEGLGTAHATPPSPARTDRQTDCLGTSVGMPRNPLYKYFASTYLS